MRIALAQLDLLVGDLQGNAARIRESVAWARDEERADLVVFPELTLTGYPPEDLLLRQGFRDEVGRVMAELTAGIRGVDALVGFPEFDGDATFNSAAWIRDGRVEAVYRKQLLPNYAVFDEKRYFTAGDAPVIVELCGVRAAVTICEDIWFPQVTAQAKAAGAELLLNLSASPYQVGRQAHREQEVLARRVAETGLPLVYVNLVCGQDELLFDGGSLVMDANGEVRARAASFSEDFLAVDFDGAQPASGPLTPIKSRVENMWRAVCLGTRDYVEKNGFEGVLVGLSGGVDSALLATLAVDALGADRVQSVMMPSEHTAQMSVEDAGEIARRLGIEHRVIPIGPAYETLLGAVEPHFEGDGRELALQNLQARLRGTILMALSNHSGRLVLITGNKSEFAVGYATLYGDMAGGFAPLKDLTKTSVYEMVRWRNGHPDTPVPERVIERPPSAELAPGQTDQDALPPYETLDAIIEGYIEQDRSIAELIADGHDPAMLERVIGMIRASEYKRRQAPPGVRVTMRAFGRDRRYPITSGYRGG